MKLNEITTEQRSDAQPPDAAAYFEAGQVVGARLEGFNVEHVVCRPAVGEIWCDVAEPVLPERGLLLDERDRAAATALIRALLTGPAAQVTLPRSFIQ